MQDTTTPTPVAPPIPNPAGDDLRREEPAGAEDESWSDVQQRIERECNLAYLYKGLKGKHCVAVYRTHARKSRDLTDAEYRILDTLLEFSNQLINCFPSQKLLRSVLGGSGRKARRVGALLQSLEKKRWIKRITFTEGDSVRGEHDGRLDVANESGRFISATGYRFRIPLEQLPPGADKDWEGDKVFTHRAWGQRARKKIRASAGTTGA